MKKQNLKKNALDPFDRRWHGAGTHTWDELAKVVR